MVSEDHQYALTLIFFVGSVFSPRYFAARKQGPGVSPLEHCGVNAVLYKKSKSSWVMTQVPEAMVGRGQDELCISGSKVQRKGTAISIDLDERTAPWGRPFRGRIEVEIEAGLSLPHALDHRQDHGWWPVGAKARASVHLTRPELRFTGSAYHDCNFGQVPLEHSFRSWTWSRAQLDDGVALLYDTVEVSGMRKELGLWIGADGMRSCHAPHQAALGKGFWGTRDLTRSDCKRSQPKILRRLEDTPFYNRSLLQSSLEGQRCVAVHESLDLERFCRPWVQFLLPFRIRNRGH